MSYHALDRHALEPPMPTPFTVVARHRPGLVLLVAVLALRVRLAATEACATHPEGRP